MLDQTNIILTHTDTEPGVYCRLHVANVEKLAVAMLPRPCGCADRLVGRVLPGPSKSLAFCLGLGQLFQACV